MNFYQDDAASTSATAAATAAATAGTCPGGRERAGVPALLKGLADYHASVVAWAQAHPGDPFPAPVLHISLQGTHPEETLAELHQIAAAWGVEVHYGEDGARTAGPLTVQRRVPAQRGAVVTTQEIHVGMIHARKNDDEITAAEAE